MTENKWINFEEEEVTRWDTFIVECHEMLVREFDIYNFKYFIERSESNKLDLYNGCS